MFLNTLGLGSFTVQSWVNKSTFSIISYESKAVSKRNIPKSTKTPDLEILDAFLDKIPKLPSHYARKDSSKLYLESTFKTINELIDCYKQNCSENIRTPLSRQVFCKKFKEKNLSICPRKKDRCDTCVAHEMGNLSDLEYSNHIQKKGKSARGKGDRQNICRRRHLHCFSNGSRIS